MKNILFTLMIFILSIAGCYAQQNTEESKGESSVLDFYRQYSSFTDPGIYAYLYEELPETLPELCKVIRSQFIHPHGELQRYRDQIPEDRSDESTKYPTVQSILEGLLSYDSSGLVKDRKPEHRLILGCREYAIVLASVLKSRGIPARVRCGHATYLIPGFHASHTICEVWNNKDKRWMLVDPATLKVDFNKEEFDFSNELWFKFQNKEIDPDKYGFPGHYTGMVSILGKISPDLAALLGNEYSVFQFAPMLDYVFQNSQLATDQTERLNEICELMKSIDSSNLSRLHEIYNATPEIQVTRSFQIE